MDNILVIADLHIPYQHKQALQCALNFASKKKITKIIILGDLLDFYQLSTFSKNPEMFDLQFEINEAIKFLNQLRKQFPKTEIIYKEGNHEERLERYIFKNSELLKLECLKIPELLKLKELNIKFINDKQIIKLGKLNLMHGHEMFMGWGSVNMARNVLMRTFTNTLFCHFHKSQEFIHKKLDNTIVGAWSVGHLGIESPDYMKINQWVHGFAIIELEKNGNFKVNNYKIFNGKVM